MAKKNVLPAVAIDTVKDEFLRRLLEVEERDCPKVEAVAEAGLSVAGIENAVVVSDRAGGANLPSLGDVGSVMNAYPEGSDEGLDRHHIQSGQFGVVFKNPLSLKIAAGRITSQTPRFLHRSP